MKTIQESENPYINCYHRRPINVQFLLSDCDNETMFLMRYVSDKTRSLPVYHCLFWQKETWGKVRSLLFDLLSVVTIHQRNTINHRTKVGFEKTSCKYVDNSAFLCFSSEGVCRRRKTGNMTSSMTSSWAEQQNYLKVKNRY